jgi:peptidoglycan/xylan/chitin deacetylase (PgdA/CDA1 family)
MPHHRARVLARTVGATLGPALLAHALPAVTALPAVRLRLFPGLSGAGDPGRVALTFDDGPDPASTPRFIEVLAAHRVRATFFLIGSMLARTPGLGGDLVAAGHEVAVHGWTHRNLLLRDPYSTYRELARTRDLVAAATGATPRFFRPPYGVLTAPALVAARRLGLTPVLWTCWGRDWTRDATPRSVLTTVRRGLAGGGTVLLHDSDCTSAPDSWRATLAGLPDLLADCARRGWQVGPLREHGLPTLPTDGPLPDAR